MSEILRSIAVRDPHETEFYQAVTEVLESIKPVLDQNPQYRQAAVLDRITEPERIVTFRIPWLDDEGNVKRTLFPFSMRYFYRFELELLLRHAGFEVDEIYGSWDLDEFSGGSEKMIAVARRAD